MDLPSEQICLKNLPANTLIPRQHGDSNLLNCYFIKHQQTCLPSNWLKKIRRDEKLSAADLEPLHGGLRWLYQIIKPRHIMGQWPPAIYDGCSYTKWMAMWNQGLCDHIFKSACVFRWLLFKYVCSPSPNLTSVPHTSFYNAARDGIAAAGAAAVAPVSPRER